MARSFPLNSPRARGSELGRHKLILWAMVSTCALFSTCKRLSNIQKQLITSSPFHQFPLPLPFFEFNDFGFFSCYLCNCFWLGHQCGKLPPVIQCSVSGKMTPEQWSKVTKESIDWISLDSINLRSHVATFGLCMWQGMHYDIRDICLA